MSGTNWASLLGDVPAERIATARWFARKEARIAAVRLLEAVELGEGAALLVIEVASDDGGRGEYALPARATAAGLVEAVPGDGVLARLAAGAAGLEGTGGGLPPDVDEAPLGSDQSNTTVALGGRVAAKCYRRLQPGPHPEVELTTYLSREARVEGVPAVRGSLAWRGADGDERALLLAQDLVPGAIDGWSWAEGVLGELLDGGDQDAATAHATGVGALTARLHVALAAAHGVPGFEPRRAGAAEREAWRVAAGRQLEQALSLLHGEARAEVAAGEPAIRARLDGLAADGPAPLLTRVHGDYHLGQLLAGAGALAVVDFEGEPTRTTAERRALSSPLRDLAGLLRSYDHLARMVLRHRGDRPEEVAVAEAWIEACRGRVLDAYGAGLAGSELDVDPVLLDAFEMEKETYEFVYAATFLPEWLYAPRAAMTALLRTPPPAAAP